MPCAGRFPQGGTMTSDVIRSNPAGLPPPDRRTISTSTEKSSHYSDNSYSGPHSDLPEAAVPRTGRGRSVVGYAQRPARRPPPPHHSPRGHKNKPTWQGLSDCRKHIYPASNELGRTLRPAVKWPSQAEPFSADLPSEGALVSVCAPPDLEIGRTIYYLDRG